jgi:K+ transporter
MAATGISERVDVAPAIHGHATPTSFWALTLGSIGVVYGDIGTSPLYALKESLAAAMRKLADAAAPLYATLDEAQKRRLQVLVRIGGRGMMGGAMMRGGSVDDGDNDESGHDNR